MKLTLGVCGVGILCLLRACSSQIKSLKLSLLEQLPVASKPEQDMSLGILFEVAPPARQHCCRTRNEGTARKITHLGDLS